MKPPFAYYGGKTRLAATIAELFPPHRVYIEPFFGSGAVLFAKDPARHEVANDLDNAVVTFFRVLRERPDELEVACRLTPTARAEYELADLDAEDLDDIEVARRFWVRVGQSFSQSAGRSTGWSVTTARTQSKADSLISRIGRFADCAERLARVQIERCDAATLIDRLATDDTVIYADPPYLDATRHSRGGGTTSTDYRVDGGGEDVHRQLAAALHATPATVFLSGYPSDLYDDLYDGWAFVDFDVVAHASNLAHTTRSRRVERVWSNRPIAAPHRQQSVFGVEATA